MEEAHQWKQFTYQDLVDEANEAGNEASLLQVRKARREGLEIRLLNTMEIGFKGMSEENEIILLQVAFNTTKDESITP